MTRQPDPDDTTNPAAEWKKRRQKVLSCSFCRPNRNENSKAKKPRPDRHKNHRRRS